MRPRHVCVNIAMSKNKGWVAVEVRHFNGLFRAKQSVDMIGSYLSRLRKRHGKSAEKGSLFPACFRLFVCKRFLGGCELSLHAIFPCRRIDKGIRIAGFTRLQ